MSRLPIHCRSGRGAKRHRKFLYLLFLLFLVAFVYNLKAMERLMKAGTTYDHTNDIQPYLDYLDNIWINSSFQLAAIKNNSTSKQENGCRIPQLTPFPVAYQQYFNDTPKINCEEKNELLFKSTFQSSIIPVKEYDYFQNNHFVSCCYRTVERNHYYYSFNTDREEIVSSKCFPISLKNPTAIPEGHEFIAIYCKMKEKSRTKEKLVDVHSFVHLKPRNFNEPNLSKNEKERKYNVVIFGLDSLSRMNFLRTMLQSHAFLKKEMGAVDMLAYNKVEENTFPNILPMLTSMTPEELKCIKGKNFDDCPFIWKKFSKEGFYTSFSEDPIASTFTFNYNKPGFWKQPTDYYTIPLIHWADNHILENECFGPRLVFQFLLDHVEKFVQKMGEANKHYFHFTWANLVHEDLNNGLVGDPHLLKTLKWLKASGNLNDTIFILMSDHGFRVGNFRKTIQGQLEDRLPFLYFVLPESFKSKYKRAFENLISNRDKLMTTFDIYQTLKDILHLKTIEENSLINREAYLTSLGKTLTRGISLFLPIPQFRTCRMAGIPLNYCTCSFLPVTDLTSPEVKDVTMVGVAYMNEILSGVVQCSQLQLSSVMMAQYTSNEEFEAYLVNFETKPGGGQFEALVGRWKKKGERWNVQGTVDRTNSYRDQSRCVQGVQLKNYCYCMT